MLDLFIYIVLGLLALVALLVAGSLVLGALALPFYLAVSVWDALRAPLAVASATESTADA